MRHFNCFANAMTTPYEYDSIRRKTNFLVKYYRCEKSVEKLTANDSKQTSNTDILTLNTANAYFNRLCNGVFYKRFDLNGRWVYAVIQCITRPTAISINIGMAMNKIY